MARLSTRLKWMKCLRRAAGPVRPAVASDASLVMCRACGRDLVYPMDWDETADGAGWWILLRCGGCEVRREVDIDDREAAIFGSRLDEQASIIERAARRMELERMRDDVEAFCEALRRDLIDATDFRRVS